MLTQCCERQRHHGHDLTSFIQFHQCVNDTDAVSMHREQQQKAAEAELIMKVNLTVEIGAKII